MAKNESYVSIKRSMYSTLHLDLSFPSPLFSMSCFACGGSVTVTYLSLEREKENSRKKKTN